MHLFRNPPLEHDIIVHLAGYGFRRGYVGFKLWKLQGMAVCFAMASRRRHENDTLSLLLQLPWSVNLTLAGIVYLALRYGFPILSFESGGGQILAKAVPQLAWLPACGLVLMAGLSALVAWSNGQLFEHQTSLEDVKALSWQDFERFVGEFYRRQGYAVQETGGGGADGGVDLVLRKEEETVYVQCKRWRNRNVGIKPTKELFATVVAEEATRGILMTTSNFSQDAQRFAGSQSERLSLVAGRDLVKMMAEVRRTSSATM
ncbi:MAG: restriction system protein [Verrucomicrobiales bacterium]